jgi:hypothetical protein
VETLLFTRLRKRSSGIQLGLGALDVRLEIVGVENGEHVAGFHGTVVVDVDVAHRAGELTRYIDLFRRLDRAGRGDEHRHVATLDRRRRVVITGAFAAGIEIGSSAEGKQN